MGVYICFGAFIEWSSYGGEGFCRLIGPLHSRDGHEANGHDSGGGKRNNFSDEKACHEDENVAGCHALRTCTETNEIIPIDPHYVQKHLAACFGQE